MNIFQPIRHPYFQGPPGGPPVEQEEPAEWDKIGKAQFSFERINAIYSTVQAALAFIQRHQKLAFIIFRIQQVLLITDIISYAATTYFLVMKVNKKFNLLTHEQGSNYIFPITAAVLGIATVALSYLVVLKINAVMKSGLILKDILAEVFPEGLKGMEIAWITPLSLKLMQCLSINRALASLALSFFSHQRSLNLFSAAAQIFSLTQISQLRFLEFSQTFTPPFGEITSVCDPSSYTFLNEFKNIKVSSTFMMHSSGPIEPSSLKSALQSMKGSMDKLWNNSWWGRDWVLKHGSYYEPGYYVGERYVGGRSVHYSYWSLEECVRLKEGLFEGCVNNLKVFLEDFSVVGDGIEFEIKSNWYWNLIW